MKMGMLDEVKQEIIGRHQPSVQDQRPETKKGRRKRTEMSKAEIEAYRQKKIAEEEARMLKQARAKQPGGEETKKGRRRNGNEDGGKPDRAEPVNAPERGTRETRKRALRPLGPLEPLHLLKIPGLPEGDCLAICYVRGAE